MHHTIDAERTSLRPDADGDNAPMLNQLLGNLAADGGGELILPRRRWAIGGTIIVPADVTLVIKRPAALECLNDRDVLRIKPGGYVTGGGRIVNMAFAAGSEHAHLLYHGEDHFGVQNDVNPHGRARIEGAEQINLVGPYHGGVGVKLLCDGPGQIIHQLRFNNVNFLRGLYAFVIQCNSPGEAEGPLSWIHSIAVTHASMQWYHTYFRLDQTPRRTPEGELCNSIQDVLADGIMIQTMGQRHEGWPITDIWGYNGRFRLHVWDPPGGDWPLYRFHPHSYHHRITTNAGPQRSDGNYSCRVTTPEDHTSIVDSYEHARKISVEHHPGEHLICRDGPDGAPCILWNDGRRWWWNNDLRPLPDQGVSP